MRDFVENLIAIAGDESIVAKRVAEMEASDYNDLMHRIDEIMELNEGVGPDSVRDTEMIQWLMRASVVAEYYEKRTFDV